MTVELGVTIFAGALAAYTCAALCYILGVLRGKPRLTRIATFVLSGGLVIHTAALVVRTVVAQRPPFLNLYEYVLSLTWGVVAVYLAIELMTRRREFGAFVTPLVALFAYLATTLPTEVNPTMAALRSGWRVPHIGTAILAYASFGIAFGLAVMYMLRERLGAGGKNRLAACLPSPETLDHTIYRTIAFGFMMQTALLVTGAIWAQYAWGRYWGWDPKEVWALITWLIYAAYLHTRTAMGWKGRRSAIVAIVGFVITMFTLLGVSLFMGGLHSYAAG